jgi:hypothetical protein
MFSSDRAAVTAFGFTDAELCAMAAEKAVRFPNDPVRSAIALLDLAR